MLGLRIERRGCWSLRWKLGIIFGGVSGVDNFGKWEIEGILGELGLMICKG